MSLQLEIGDIKETIPANKSLLFEIGESYFMFSVYDQQQKSLNSVRFASVNTLDLLQKTVDAINEIKNIGFDSVIICSAFANAVLVPRKSYNQNANHKIFDKNQYQLEASLPEWQMTILFSLPKPLYQKLDAAFPRATITHCYAPALKIYNGFVAQNQISVHFVPNQFRVMVKKGQHLQLAQMYNYSAPLDVVYYLLKICSEFHFSQTETFLIVSGFIEESSALYRELNAYFSNVHFAAKPAVSVVENPYPEHYFTSMYNLASCV